MNYTYRTEDIQRVPGHRPTEPALRCTFDARWIANEREANFDSEALVEDERDEYLESIKEELHNRSKALKYQIYEIGKLLCEVKKHLVHGEFKPWVKANFEQTYRTAHNCMKVYKACMGHPEFVEYFNPSCLYIICSNNFPEELREALFDGAKGLVDIHKKELVELGMKFRKGEINFNDEEVQSVLKKQRETSILEKYIIELQALKTLIKSRLEKIRQVSYYHRNEPLIVSTEDGEKMRIEDKRRNIEERIEAMSNGVAALIDELEIENETVS